LIGSQCTIFNILLNTTLIPFIKGQFELDNMDILIVRKIGWLFYNLGKFKKVISEKPEG
jgi:hypothetical protein